MSELLIDDDTWRRMSDYNAYMRLRQAAAHTYHNVTESWKRPKRHNRKIERAALFWSLQLDDECVTIANRHIALPRPDTADVATRYEVQAGIRTVRAILPFTSRERATMPGRTEIWRNPEFEADDPSMGLPLPDHRLVERWHQWLWMDENGKPQTSVTALGQSAILAEASGRLSEAVLEVAESLAPSTSEV